MAVPISIYNALFVPEHNCKPQFNTPEQMPAEDDVSDKFASLGFCQMHAAKLDSLIKEVAFAKDRSLCACSLHPSKLGSLDQDAALAQNDMLQPECKQSTACTAPPCDEDDSLASTAMHRLDSDSDAMPASDEIEWLTTEDCDQREAEHAAACLIDEASKSVCKLDPPRCQKACSVTGGAFLAMHDLQRCAAASKVTHTACDAIVISAYSRALLQQQQPQQQQHHSLLTS